MAPVPGKAIDAIHHAGVGGPGRPSRPAPGHVGVIGVAGTFVALVAGWALVAPGNAQEILGVTVGWISEWFGWFYTALATSIVVFVVYVGIRHSRVRLGREDDRPEFSTITWASMLFAAGIGTDLMFFAVAEPASQ